MIYNPDWDDSTRQLAYYACWYAWGRQDAGGTLDPYEFASRYGDLVHRGDGSRPAIQDYYAQEAK